MKKIRSLNQLLYEVSVYSFKKNVEVDCNKFKLQYLSDLADHQNVKAAYCNEYGLVALYDEGKNLNMIIQVWSKDCESPQNAAINWLNYLNIVSQSDDSDAKVEENKKQTESNINESNPSGWSLDKCKQLVQKMYDNLSEWAKGLLPEEDLPVVWGEKLLADRYIVCDRFYLTSEGYLKAKINTVNSQKGSIPIVSAIECAVTNCCCSRNYFEYGKTRNCDCEEKEFHNRRNNNGETGVYEQNRAKGNLLKFR
ncbi:MAG: hypothetical protein J6C20_02235 [Paludibacteraceae bacterium]|nr:hypothetical protein [Paludibacteraceae bacterium]